MLGHGAQRMEDRMNRKKAKKVDQLREKRKEQIAKLRDHAEKQHNGRFSGICPTCVTYKNTIKAIEQALLVRVFRAKV